MKETEKYLFKIYTVRTVKVKKLMKSIKQANCPLEHLYVRAYSFQIDQNFKPSTVVLYESSVITSLKYDSWLINCE